MTTPLPDSVSATLRSDPTAALAAAFVIAGAHAELFSWVARMVCDATSEAQPQPMPKPSGPHGAKPPPPVTPKPNGSTARLALGNGAEAARPFAPAAQRHPAAIQAAEAEARIAELVRDRPGLRTSEIAKETRAKVNTTVERLKRMAAKGLIERQDPSAGWRASATKGPPA